MTKTKLRKVALYTRVSQDRTGEAESPDLHIAEARRYVEAQGHTVVAEYIDRDVSGYSKALRTRPAMVEILAGIAAGEIDGVAVQRLDRFSRRMGEALGMLEELKASGVEFLCASEQVDTSTAMGRAMAGVLFAIGEQYSETHAKNVARAWEARAAVGAPHVTGQRTYGYTVAHELIPAEAKAGRRIVNDLLAGRSLNGIAVDLNARGVTTSTGGKWSGPSVRQWAKSPTIAGLRVHRTESDRKANRPGTITPGTWAGIITPDQRDALLVRLGSYRGTAEGSAVPVAPSTLLTGVVRCGTCGEKMAKRIDRYTCSTGRSNTHACGKVAAMIARVDEIAVEALVTHVSDLVIPSWAARRLDPMSIRADVTRLESDLSEATRARYVTKTIPSDEAYAIVRDEITEALDRLRAQLVEAEADGAESGIPFGAGREAVEAWWASADLVARRLAVRDVFERVTVAPAIRGGCRFEAERVTWEKAGGGPLYDTEAEADAAA